MAEPTDAPLDAGLLRVAALGLLGPPAETAEAAVGDLLAAQGQDLRSVRSAIAIRTRARTATGVDAAFDAGTIVRSWPVRGTLHVLPAEDLGWLLGLLGQRQLRIRSARHRALGLTDADFTVARDTAVRLLAETGPAARRDLAAAWAAAGVSPAGQRGVHLLGALALTGVLVLGPLRDGEQLVAAAETWIRHPRRLERDEALRELALRYFRGHGPASADDLARWAGLTRTETRVAVALAEPDLDRIRFGDRDHFMAPGTPARLHAAGASIREVLLLPGFDELVLGYADRAPQLAPEHEAAVVPGGNGIYRPTVVRDGRVIGTWAREPAGGIRFEPFEPADARTTAAVRAAAPPPD